MSLHVQTPCLDSMAISNTIGKSVLLKMECFQPTGSFKIRGIGLLCEESVRSGKSHFISSSGGNAGYAVAYAGRKLGAKVTVIVPETTPWEVCQQIKLEGAEVRVHGAVWDESHNCALKLSQKLGAAYIPPFDHPIIWRGHSTIVDEIVQQCRQRPDAIVLSVGGGGLLCGVVEGLSRNNWQDVPIIGVETEGAASLSASVTKGRLVTLDRINTIATSLGAKQVADQAFKYAQTHPIVPFTVSDASAIDACQKFLYDHRVLVEPACGAALSVVYNDAQVVKSALSIMVIVCGGIGVSAQRIVEWQQEN